MTNSEYWAMIGSIGQVAGAIMQFLIAAIAAWIAWRAYRYTKKQNAINFVKLQNEMINTFNQVCISSKENLDVSRKLREPVIGYPDDIIIFMYLNFMHTAYVINKENMLPKEYATSMFDGYMKNGVTWMIGLRKDQLERLLSRGYEPSFRNAILKVYDEMCK